MRTNIFRRFRRFEGGSVAERALDRSEERCARGTHQQRKADRGNVQEALGKQRADRRKDVRCWDKWQQQPRQAHRESAAPVRARLPITAHATKLSERAESESCDRRVQHESRRIPRVAPLVDRRHAVVRILAAEWRERIDEQ